MADYFRTVAAMIDDLRGGDRDSRLVAMRNLQTIAQTLGPGRTRDELLPYVCDYLDDDDEVLRAMAAALGRMLDEVGGPAHAAHLLRPLETLCTLDDVTVRDAAVAALTALGRGVLLQGAGGAAEAEQGLAAVLRGLADSDHPPSRSSAAGLCGVVLAKGGAAAKAAARKALAALAKDREVMVRRAACVALGAAVAPALERGVGEFTPLLVQLSRDANESVRLQAIPAAAAVLPHLTDAQAADLTAAVKALGQDDGWRVRFMLADQLGALARVWRPPVVAATAVPLFVRLCGDASAEIRAAAVHTVDELLAGLGDAPAQHAAARADAVAAACRLAGDENQHTRACAAGALLKAAPHTAPGAWSEHLIPACRRLLQDEDAEVRLGVVTSFSALAAANAAQGGGAAAGGGAPQGLQAIATELVPAVVALAKDGTWRVRESVIAEVPGIMQSGAAATAGLVDVSVDALTDRVAAIRTAGAAACCQMLVAQGGGWAATHLAPRLKPLAQARHFMHRAVLLHVLRLWADAADAGFLKAEVLPLTARLAADPVGNVRMAAAHVVRALAARRKLPASEVDPLAARLKADADPDVRDVITMGALPGAPAANGAAKK